VAAVALAQMFGQYLRLRGFQIQVVVAAGLLIMLMVERKLVALAALAS
jgi:hypothetical protein